MSLGIKDELLSHVDENELWLTEKTNSLPLGECQSTQIQQYLISVNIRRRFFS